MKNKHGEKIDFKYNLKIYWNLLKKYKYLAIFVVLLAILIELRFLIDKFLLKIVIDRGNEFGTKIITQESFIHVLIILAVIYITIIAISFILIWLKEHFIIKLETRMMLDLKKKFFNHLIELHHDFHTTHKTGSLISRLLRGGWSIERMSDTLIYQFAPLIINIIAVTASLIYFDRTSALITILTVIAFVSYSFYLQKKQETPNLEAIRAEDIEKGNISDFLTNIDSIKYYGKEKQVKNRFLRISEKTRNAQEKHWNYFRWLGSVHTIILGLGYFFVFYFSLKSFIAGNISL